MPVEKKYPIEEIADFLNSVTSSNHGGRITLEYVMRKDNISREDAKHLKEMFRYSSIKLNLIPLNAAREGHSSPSESEIQQFIKHCEIINVPISVRKSLGSEIEGACGQLSGRKYYEEKE
jgi:23S rRNA (adenine2503-C2)-methyltransferase